MTDLFHAAQKAGITVEYCRIPLNASLSVQDEGGDFVLMDYSLLKDETNERGHMKSGIVSRGRFITHTLPMTSAKSTKTVRTNGPSGSLYPKAPFSAHWITGIQKFASWQNILT